MSKAKSTELAIQKNAFMDHYCDCVCKYEKPNKHLALAFFKRHSNRVTRRRLAAELRRQLNE